uniref:Uncharacterized protein n=1 Tax=Leersia perrieri TaxID=77586 RepID=A0A0D9Y1I2_9ORYZ
MASGPIYPPPQILGSLATEARLSLPLSSPPRRISSSSFRALGEHFRSLRRRRRRQAIAASDPSRRRAGDRGGKRRRSPSS